MACGASIGNIIDETSGSFAFWRLRVSSTLISSIEPTIHLFIAVSIQPLRAQCRLNCLFSKSFSQVLQATRFDGCGCRRVAIGKSLLSESQTQELDPQLRVHDCGLVCRGELNAWGSSDVLSYLRSTAGHPWI